jgi:hypothetical protein
MREFIEKVTGKKLADSDWNLLSSFTKHSEFPKGHHLIEEGQKCKSILYLKKGALRFFENINGNYRVPAAFQTSVWIRSKKKRNITILLTCH